MTPEQVIKDTIDAFLGDETNLTDEQRQHLAHWIVGYLQRAGYEITHRDGDVTP